MSGDYFADSSVGTLLPQHEAMLKASGICADVALARGYRSVLKKVELERYGFQDYQRRAPTLLIPIFNVHGENVLNHHRPDTPRHDRKRNRPLKYEFPTGECLAVDVHPFLTKKVRDPSIPLFITEGVKKADAAISAGLCCIAVVGTWNWRGTNEFGGKTALPDWDGIALKDKTDQGRQVILCHDSDCMLKWPVYQALERLSRFLKHRGANVAYIYLPPGEDGKKMGLDDYLATGKTPADLMALVTTELRRPPRPETQQAVEPSIPYEETEHGLVWCRETEKGSSTVPLTNFCARITADVLADDGVEVLHEYQIEARRGPRRACFTIPATSFASLSWAAEHLGAGTFVYPGFTLRDHAQVAIRQLSDEPPEQRIFTHIGWRQLEGERWVYLTADAVIGTSAEDNVAVRLSGTLARYSLPEPPQGEELCAAVRATLRLLDLAPDRVTVPVVAAVFRSVLGMVDFSLSIAGRTGAFKSELTSLAQRHFGANMDRMHLPGSWSSTENALEELAFGVKDAVLSIDDFTPLGGDAQRLHAKADRVLRAQGNGSGRQRMNRDGTLRPERPPRGLIISTGEDVPQGQSLKARQFIVEVLPGDIDSEKLKACQHDAGSGLYAACMAGFVAWFAPLYPAWRSTLPSKAEALRDRLAEGTIHRRTPGMVADLALGINTLSMFARELGVLTEDEAQTLEERALFALRQAGAEQATHQQGSEPTTRFVDLLRNALSAGRAHVANLKGFHPDSDPKSWGWVLRVFGVGENERSEWQAQGEKIGYTDGKDLYLLPDVAYSVAGRLSRDNGDALTLTPRTLWKRLNEAGFLCSTDKARETLPIRRTLEGTQQNVLHLAADTLVSVEADKSDVGDGPQEDEDFQWEGITSQNPTNPTNPPF